MYRLRQRIIHGLDQLSQHALTGIRGWHVDAIQRPSITANDHDDTSLTCENAI